MKKTKVVLSIVLAMILVVTTLAPAFASGKKCDCGTAPIVQVRGIGETLYDGEGNPVFSAESAICVRSSGITALSLMTSA